MQRAFFITAAAIAVTTEAIKFEYTPENQILAELESQVGKNMSIPNRTDFWKGGNTVRRTNLTPFTNGVTVYAPEGKQTLAEGRMEDWPYHSAELLANYLKPAKIPCKNYVDPADELMQLWMI